MGKDIRIKSSGYVFGGQYKPKQHYKPDYMKGYRYVVAMLLFSLSLWMLFYNIGVSQ